MTDSALNGFRDVDASADPQEQLRYLQALSEHPMMRERAAARLAASGIATGGTVADLGCGLGGDAIMLARHVGPGGRAIGLDASGAMIAFARGRPDAAGLPVEWRQGDVSALPFDASSLDACWVERVLIHVPDPGATLAEMRRVLRPGGVAVVQEYEYRGMLLDTADPGVWDIVRGRFDAAIRNRNVAVTMARLAQEAGFSQVESRPELVGIPGFDLMAAALRVQASLAASVEAGELTEARAQAWWEEQRATHAAGRMVHVAGFTLFARR
jgi:SAM-dependent methyltransferase